METILEKITVKAVVNASAEKVWKAWNEAEHVIRWNNASDDWHTPKAENDLRVGGKFLYRMEAKDGSFGFDFIGTYDEVKLQEKIAYTMEDGRKVVINFITDGTLTEVIETFDPEQENSLELQKTGWQAILDNFKKYTESLA